jgi:predicted RNA-binding Zn ribbon-like protein
MARRPKSAASADALARWRVSVDETGQEPFCLALANTRNWRHGPEPLERLHGYRDLVTWIERRDFLDADGLAALERQAVAHPRIAARELADTIALREDVFRVFSDEAGGRPPASRALERLVAGFNDAVARVVMIPERGRLQLRLRQGEQALDIVRVQASLSAMALLTSGHIERVRECADDRGCGWLFVDSTRNGSRRFCFANECGNRARQAAFRERQRGAAV